ECGRTDDQYTERERRPGCRLLVRIRGLTGNVRSTAARGPARRAIRRNGHVITCAAHRSAPFHQRTRTGWQIVGQSLREGSDIRGWTARQLTGRGGGVRRRAAAADSLTRRGRRAAHDESGRRFADELISESTRSVDLAVGLLLSRLRAGTGIDLLDEHPRGGAA